MNPVLLAGLKGLALTLAVGAASGAAVYSQSNSLRLGLVAGIAASATQVIALLAPSGAMVAISNAKAAAKPAA